MPPKKKSKVDSDSVEKLSSEEPSVDLKDKPKRGRKKSNVLEETATPKLQNQTSTEFNAQEFLNSSKTEEGKDWNFKVASWNVDGLRAWLKVCSTSKF